MKFYISRVLCNDVVNRDISKSCNLCITSANASAIIFTTIYCPKFQITYTQHESRINSWLRCECFYSCSTSSRLEVDDEYIRVLSNTIDPTILERTLDYMTYRLLFLRTDLVSLLQSVTILNWNRSLLMSTETTHDTCNWFFRDKNRLVCRKKKKGGYMNSQIYDWGFLFLVLRLRLNAKRIFPIFVCFVRHNCDQDYEFWVKI